MDDAFTLLRHATGLLPAGARTTSGAAIEDVHDSRRQQDWEFVLDLLLEFGDEHPIPAAFWPLLTDAARQLRLPDIAEWCGWRAGEARFGTVRAWLSLRRTAEGGRRSPFPGRGQLDPLWDIGNRAPGGDRAFNFARLWVEGTPELSPGESAMIRLAPLSPDQWRHLAPGDAITLHEGQPVLGTATITEVAPPLI
ncbi:hypothetical protein [Streptomyces sp. NRRL F-5755]|uniref:hypothetical protein n=1 Tax=Streptomyces sp. NRRL F-5755 TaxID=1519475 RepID=UPI000AE341F5|nr:hypothetical protein [Streptomyces sp. NRRL F-5755]